MLIILILTQSEKTHSSNKIIIEINKQTKKKENI